MEEKTRPLPTPTSTTQHFWDTVNAEAMEILSAREAVMLAELHEKQQREADQRLHALGGQLR